MTTSTRLILAMTLLLSATAGALAQGKAYFHFVNSDSPALTGGGSMGYNENLPKDTD